jgi:hypothetical protein
MLHMEIPPQHDGHVAVAASPTAVCTVSLGISPKLLVLSSFHPSTKRVPCLFPVVKLLERGVDHPPPSIAEVKERVELYLYFPSAPSCLVTVITTFSSRLHLACTRNQAFLLFYIMLCYVTLRYVMLCYVMLCYVMLCY